jgi:uncharacterized phage protein (TIGR02218 family)
MSDMESGLGAALTDELTNLAICWQVLRQDGVGLGFTTHDRPLIIGGMCYGSAPGMAPSAVVSSDGLDIDTMDVAGALSADAITAGDLGLGRYDGAIVRLFMVDWRDPDGGRQPLACGTLGTVEAGTGPDAGFTATLRGPTAVLSATRIETYSPECRAELGDWRCRVAMRGRALRTPVTGADGDHVELDGVDMLAAGDYLAGRLRVLSGPLAGVERRIIAIDANRLRLDEALALPVSALVEITHGCDKQFSTCVTRFANAANFRGEPHVPGGDVLTRFGGL